LWALPEVRALTPDELEAHMRAQEEPEEDAEEAQADAVAADKAEEGRAASSAAPDVIHRSSNLDEACPMDHTALVIVSKYAHIMAPGDGELTDGEPLADCHNRQQETRG